MESLDENCIDHIEDNHNSTFEWNGTCLGEISKNNITTVKINNNKYWIIRFGDRRLISEVIHTSNKLASIIDELKVIFKIAKLGTHRAILDGKEYLLTRPRIVNNSIVLEPSILDIKKTNKISFIHRVQEVYLFRVVMGALSNAEKMIYIRKPIKSYISPYPVCRHIMDVKTTSMKLPMVTMKRWYGSLTLADVARRLFQMYDMTQLGDIIGSLNVTIENIIRGIDKTLVHIGSLVINNITALLNSSISYDEELIEYKDDTADWDTTDPPSVYGLTNIYCS